MCLCHSTHANTNILVLPGRELYLDEEGGEEERKRGEEDGRASTQSCPFYEILHLSIISLSTLYPSLYISLYHLFIHLTDLVFNKVKSSNILMYYFNIDVTVRLPVTASDD